MKPEYWLERWREGRTRFHRTDVNPGLVQHQPAVLGEVIRVLVPLCGKTHDLEWLAVQGYEVVGIELSDIAARAFFEERGITPERHELAHFVEYRHGAIKILVGDFFDASPSELDYFDGVYDRAAMIALPEDLRARYCSHLQTLLAPKAKLLLLTLHFDAAGGPPFSVAPEEVTAAYRAAKKVTQLASVDAKGDTPGAVERGASFVHENVYAIEFT